MTTVHFVYSIPPLKRDRFLSYYDYFAKQTSILPPSFRYGHVSWPKPIRAPQSITYNLFNALKKVVDVKLYDFNENGKCKMKSGDIFLGHPRPAGFSSGIWKESDKRSITHQTLQYFSENKKYIISPYNHDERQNKWAEEVLKMSDGFIAICGKYWTDSWDRSPLKKSVKKLFHVDMAVNAADYPRVKKRFNKEGKRRFIYIGRTEHPKNIGQLESIAVKMDNFEGGFIGPGNIKGWKKIADYANLTPAYISKISEDYDIFLHTSEFDAQATIVLEMMLWGFPVACTKESGISYPSTFQLSTIDIEYNLDVLKRVQSLSEPELIRLADENEHYAKTNHNWEIFTSSIIQYLELQ